jgi:integrase
MTLLAHAHTHGPGAPTFPLSPMPIPVTPAPQPADVTVSALLDLYEQEYLPSKAPTTAYQTQRMFLFFRAELGHLPLSQLTPAVCRQWRDSLAERFRPGTVRQYLDLLSGPLTVAVKDYEWLPKNPLHHVQKPPEPPGRERCLMEGELLRLLEACKQSRNPHLYLLVLLALSTGARKNELLERRWHEIDLVKGLVQIPHSKNGERRVVPITGFALEVLRHQAAHRRQGCDWVFPRFDGQRPSLIEHAWRLARTRAGIEDVHFHDLRHTAASYLAMSGAAILDIATMLGHKSLQMTKKYSHLTTSHLEQVASRMTTQFLPQPEEGGLDEPA